MLGTAIMEKSVEGFRFAFYQKGDHFQYLLWLHKQLLNLGYCKEDIPRIFRRKGAKGELAYYCVFRSFTYSSFY